jgi:hypothetical protein
MNARNILLPVLRVTLGLMGFLTLRTVSASDDGIRVSVVVDMTDDGEKLPRPDPAKPTYYFPWTVGYVEKGDILTGEKPPPPAWGVQHLIAKALAQRGYLVAKRGHPPSIVLILWWGYFAPEIDHMEGMRGGGSAFDTPNDSLYLPGVGISAGTKHGNGQAAGGGNETAAQYMGPGASLPLGAVWQFMDSHDAYTMVAGANFSDELTKFEPVTNELNQAVRRPRYFLMVSAIDFKSATQKKPVLLWCARVSTELQGRNLADVLPILVSSGVPRFGESTNGPHFFTMDRIPIGRVEAGTPVVKSSGPAP